MLIDLQAARRSRGAAARLRDLGRLDHSLRRLLSRGDRVRLRAAALGTSAHSTRTRRARVRAVGAASLARARAHAAAARGAACARAGARSASSTGRTRTSVARVRCRRGARCSRRRPLRSGFEVRRYRAARCAARRAWAVAHALEASDLACVTPVAFLEWSRFGMPLRSVLVVAAIRRSTARRHRLHRRAGRHDRAPARGRLRHTRSRCEWNCAVPARGGDRGAHRRARAAALPGAPVAPSASAWPDSRVAAAARARVGRLRRPPCYLGELIVTQRK